MRGMTIRNYYVVCEIVGKLQSLILNFTLIHNSLSSSVTCIQTVIFRYNLNKYADLNLDCRGNNVPTQRWIF